MPRRPDALTARCLDFLTERHLATLATTRADGTVHVVAVGFTYDAATATARVITADGSQKVRNAERGGYAALTQIDGPRWLTLEGAATVRRTPAAVRDAEQRYAVRYRTPRPNPARVVIEVQVSRVLGSRSLFEE